MLSCQGAGVSASWGMFSLRLSLLVCQMLLAWGGLSMLVAEEVGLPFLERLRFRP